MSPETNVEYKTSPSFPVIRTASRDFFPGQVPGKSMVIYESRGPVLGGYDQECIFVKNQSKEFCALYASSEHSQGKLLSQKDAIGYYFWVNENDHLINVRTMPCCQGTGGFRKNLPLWIVKEGKLINQFPNRFFRVGVTISSDTEIALIPVISEYNEHTGLIFCDQSDLAKPAVKNFIKEILGGKTRLPLDRAQMDIPVLAGAVKV